MFTPGQGVLERLNQSFVILKGNFLGIIFPLLLFKVVTIVLIGTVLTIVFFSFLDLGNLNSISDFSFAELYTNPRFITFVAVSIFFFLLFIFLYIPFYLATFRGISQAYKNENITLKDNIIYGFQSLVKSMSVYWYIFKYVALLPSIGIIMGGLFSIYGLYLDNEMFQGIGVVFIGFTFFLGIFYIIYRSVKVRFVFPQVIDKNDFEITNFKKSLLLSDNNWWRIVGNFLLIGILISLIGSIISTIISTFFVFSQGDILSAFNITNTGGVRFDQQVLIEKISQFSTFHFGGFIKSIFEALINTIKIVFILVFTYVFYKRLELEKQGL